MYASLLQAISREISGTRSGVSDRCSWSLDLGQNADLNYWLCAACSGVLRILIARYGTPCVSTQDVTFMLYYPYTPYKIYRSAKHKKPPRDKAKIEINSWCPIWRVIPFVLHRPMISYDWPQPAKIDFFPKRIPPLNFNMEPLDPRVSAGNDRLGNQKGKGRRKRKRWAGVSFHPIRIRFIRSAH